MNADEDMMEENGSAAGDEGSESQKTSRVYDYIKVIPSADGSKSDQICKFCGYKKVSREIQTTVLAKHLIQCAECPQAAKQLIAKTTRSREVRAAAMQAGLLASDEASSVPMLPPGRWSVGRLSNSNIGNQERSESSKAASGTVTPQQVSNSTPVNIRSYVKLVTLPSGMLEQQCIFCDFKSQAEAFDPILMSKHIISCPSAPVVAKCAVAKNCKSKEVEEAALAEGVLTGDPPTKPIAPIVTHQDIEAFTGPTGAPPKADQYSKVTPLPNGKYEQSCIFCGFKREIAKFHATHAAVHVVQCSQAPLALKMAVAAHSRSTEVTGYAKVAGLFTSDDVALVSRARKKSKSLTGSKGVLQSSPSTPTPSKFVTIGGDYGAAETSSSSTKRKRATPAGTRSSRSSKAAAALDQESAWTIPMNAMKFIAGCALPIEVVHSPHFLALLQSMNRDYAEQNWLPRPDILIKDWLPKLYDSIVSDVKLMWKGEGNAKRTMGVDTFVDEMGNKVFIFSEALLDKVCFSHIEVVQEDAADTEYVADLLIRRLEAAAQASSSSGAIVEDTFCAVTLDNLVEHLEATKKVQEKYPKILMNGCRSRCMSMLNADIYEIAEIEQLMQSIESLLNFIINNPAVAIAYKRSAKKAGAKKIKTSAIKVEPGTRIGVASDIKIEVLLGPDNNKNIEVLTQLVTADSQEWAAVVKGLPHEEVEAFTTLLVDETFLEKVKAFRRLSKPLRLLTQHFESTEARSSWICGAFEAFWTDVDIWCNDSAIQHLFQQDTFTQVKKIVDERWVGEGNVQEGLYSEDYFMAAILDPATLPPVESLPQNWLPQCEEILTRFYDEKDLDLARRELMRIVLRQGYWGDQVNKVQDSLNGSIPDSLMLATEKVVYIQTSNAHERPHLLWQAVYKSHFPLLEEVATRLLVMSTRCGQVERSCLRNNIYSKVTNRMDNPTVQQLLYCHINLRLTNDEEAGTEYPGFLDQAILDMGAVAAKDEKNSKTGTADNTNEDGNNGAGVAGGSKENDDENEEDIMKQEDGGDGAFERDDDDPFEL